MAHAAGSMLEAIRVLAESLRAVTEGLLKVGGVIGRYAQQSSWLIDIPTGSSRSRDAVTIQEGTWG